jgi:hypothetical protein
VQIYSKAQLSIQTPVSPFMNQQEASGYAQLHIDGETSPNNLITIPANGELVVWAEIIAPSTYRSFFEQGNTTLTLFISRADNGFFLTTDEIPFDKQTFSNSFDELVIQ